MKLFESVAMKAPKRNKFDLSHERKFSMKMGKLVPIMIEEILPGDKFRVNSEILIRFAPLLAPMMHRVNVFTHWFFVPNRLTWSEWETFITGGKDGTSAPTPPTLNAYELYDATDWWGTGSLADYMGIPIGAGTNPATFEPITALPFRAYQLIYQEYFRDQNLTDELGLSLAGGPITDPVEARKLLTLRTRAWEKDYFTSCLPWAQRGGEVAMPFTGDPTVNYKTPYSQVKSGAGNAPDGALASSGGQLVANSQQARIENIESIDMSSTGIAINDLRKSVRLQEWLEKNARGGARYVEQLLSHFGVHLGDYRAQRPIYLGGGINPVVISEVLSNFQFSGDAEGQPQGHMAGHGIAVGNQHGFAQQFKEHGYVVGVMSVIPKTAYHQGLHRMWSKFDKFDYAWPEFANIGEQEVLNKEVLFNPWSDGAGKDLTFGYQSRYAEYKYKNSTIHGEFATTLNHWHMGRALGPSRPVLNESFVMSDPTTRVFAVENDPTHLYAQVYHKVDALRPLPYFGTPRL